MVIHNVYLNEEIEKEMFKEIEKRRKKGEAVAGKLIGKSHIIQEALKTRYKIR